MTTAFSARSRCWVTFERRLPSVNSWLQFVEYSVNRTWMPPRGNHGRHSKGGKQERVEMGGRKFCYSDCRFSLWSDKGSSTVRFSSRVRRCHWRMSRGPRREAPLGYFFPKHRRGAGGVTVTRVTLERTLAVPPVSFSGNPLAATHVHFAGFSERRTEALLGRGGAVQRHDPTSNRIEYDENHARDKDAHQD